MADMATMIGRVIQRIETVLLGDKEQEIDRKVAQFLALKQRASDRALDRLADALEADAADDEASAQDGEGDA